MGAMSGSSLAEIEESWENRRDNRGGDLGEDKAETRKIDGFERKLTAGELRKKSLAEAHHGVCQ